MTKKRIIAASIIIAVLLSIFFAYRYTQYILVWQANPHIKVDGIKLMMTQDDTRHILGEEEEHIPGFGCYLLKYQSKGISLTFLNDIDTDFCNKVNEINISNNKYEIYDVRVGDDYKKALNTIQNHGFTRQKQGVSGYFKMNMYIVLEENYYKVESITIGVRDRVASARTY